MKSVISMMAVFGACAASAAAVVSDVSLQQNGARVSISYSLSADAIVTCTIQTNSGAGGWMALSDEQVRTVSGAVNRKVIAGGPQTIVWKPARDFKGSGVAGANVRAVVKAWELDNPPDYMVVDLKTPNTVNYYVSTNALPGGIGDARYRNEKLLMRRIRAAGQTFRMGSPETELARKNASNQETPHLVSFTRDYWIGVFQFTYGQMRLAYMANYKGKLHTDETDADFLAYPAENVSCNVFFGSGDAVGDSSVCKTMANLTGVAIGLPTEAEWEFAARAGVGAGLPNGKYIYSNTLSPNSLNEIAWNRSNAGTAPEVDCTTHPVGLLKPNNWGLYDVIGNVREVCRDGCSSTMPAADVVDPFVSLSTTDGNRVARGGECKYYAQNDRLAARQSVAGGTGSADNGFRLYAPCPAE